MIAYQNDPPVISAKPDALFTQVIQMRDDKRVLGKAAWNITSPSEGVVQILELWIDPSIRRAGHGRRLIGQIIAQARELHKAHKQPLRRLWVAVGHKTQVIGRSFLTGEGFHHIGSSGGLLKDQDMLIYVKSLD